MARNSYPGPCIHCGLTVAAGTGHFRKVRGGWVVHHHNYGTKGGVTCEKAKRQKPPATAAETRTTSYE